MRNDSSAARARQSGSARGEPVEPRAVGPRSWLALAAALPLLLLLAASLETAPGLHADEAWVALATHHVARLGESPPSGMNGYTGSLHLYVLAGVVRLFGERLLVFRSVSVLLNAVFVLAAAGVARRLTRRAPGWPWAGVLVASSPLFLLESRFTTELTSFVPAMLMGGLALSLWDRPRRWAGLAFAALGGFLMGLACYTHAAALLFVIAAGAGTLAALRARAFREPLFWATAAGLLLGFTPRLLQLSAAVEAVKVLSASTGAQGSLTADLRSVVPILAGVLDGELLYLRFTGQELWPVVPYATIAIAGVAALRIAVREPLDSAERALLASALAALALTAVFTPQLSLRYFMFVAWAVQLWLFVTVVRLRQLASPSAGRAGRVATALLASVVALNLTYVLVDFHVAFARTGGRPALFPLGSRLQETSNHFVRTDRLYRELVDRGVRGAVAEDFIAVPLTYYEQLERRGLLLGALPVEVLPPQDRFPHPDPGFALVYYARPADPTKQPAFDFAHADQVRVGALVFRRDASYDPNFRVFLSPAASGRRGAGARD